MARPTKEEVARNMKQRLHRYFEPTKESMDLMASLPKHHRKFMVWLSGVHC